MIETREQAIDAIDAAWPVVCAECSSVLGSELHYQAMIYHALRTAGQVPLSQLGMNVKQWIPDVRSDLFRKFDAARHQDYRGGFEPIPDVVIFSPDVAGDWRRRSAPVTMTCMLAVIEVKASERAGGRLSPAEVAGDIRKLAAHREEIRFRGHDFYPVMLVIDSAREVRERMTSTSISDARRIARDLGVEWRYVGGEEMQVDRPGTA